MRHKLIWSTAGMIALWMIIMGGTILLDFDRVQQSNQATAELEWLYICDEIEYTDISVIEGGENFIARDEISAIVMDEKGKTFGWTYDSLEPIGNGYVRFENTPTGAAIKDEDGNNKRTVIGVLNDRGEELPKKEALELLYGEEENLNQTQEKKNNADSRTGSRSEEDIDGADSEASSTEESFSEEAASEQGGNERNTASKSTAKYRVAKGDRKYVGIKDIAGNWHIPPVFDKIELTMDQKYAVIKNGGNIGIAVLEE